MPTRSPFLDALIAKWRAEANEIRADGDYCCSLTRLHDADDLEVALRADAGGPQEQCICAAIQLPNGEVWRGHRHDDCIHVAGKAGATRAEIAEAEQGFVTSRNRFVGRDEGARIQMLAGIKYANTDDFPTVLFSEDLYLRDWRSTSAVAVDAGGPPAACEACRGSGVVPVWDSARRDDWHQQTCPVCNQHAAIPAPPAVPVEK